MAVCSALQVFRHRETREYRVAPCRQWRCAGCARLLARQWRQLLRSAAQHGEPPAYFLTLTTKDPLPLWREAPPAEREAQRGQAAGLARMLTRALTRVVAEIRREYGARSDRTRTST